MTDVTNVTPTTDAWDPAQYHKFQAERARPFHDLVAMVKPHGVASVIDLGCGSGELTATLPARFPGARVLGVDNSPAMLRRAADHAGASVAFREGDIAALRDLAGYDLVLSNAALQWVPGHDELFPAWLGAMRPSAQIAVQVPKNAAHASHAVAAEVAGEPPFREALGGFVARSHALALERYAEVLYQHGFREQECLERVYGHELASTADVVEWVKGTLLTAYVSRLDGPTSARFVAAYRARLIERVGAQAPYFYPFRRLFFWARRG